MVSVLPPLSLYVHIPWCERKCPYCDFNSHEAREEVPEGAYVDALLGDLERDGEFVQGRSVCSVFVGGGTPSLFSAGAIARLLDGVRRLVALEADAEVTLEANPGSAEAAKFAAFVAAGVNRLSIGIQSFDDGKLAALGRIHNSAQALAAIDMARHSGAASFNIDLMHGLPGQTEADGLKDLRIACREQPPHLSWYQLTIEPNTVFHRRPPALPDEEVLCEIEDGGEALLRDAGYRAYEVSAWARAGRECRHNVNYWEFGDYLGIGAGAHGKLTLPGDGIYRTAKPRQPAKYLAHFATAPNPANPVRPAAPANAANTAIPAERRKLDAPTLKLEFMMNALRLQNGFTSELFETRTGLPFTEVAAPIENLLSRNLLERAGQHLRPTPFGFRHLNALVAEFVK